MHFTLEHRLSDDGVIYIRWCGEKEIDDRSSYTKGRMVTTGNITMILKFPKSRHAGMSKSLFSSRKGLKKEETGHMRMVDSKYPNEEFRGVDDTISTNISHIDIDIVKIEICRYRTGSYRQIFRPSMRCRHF